VKHITKNRLKNNMRSSRISMPPMRIVYRERTANVTDINGSLLWIKTRAQKQIDCNKYGY
jgi:hypothetical protein